MTIECVPCASLEPPTVERLPIEPPAVRQLASLKRVLVHTPDGLLVAIKRSGYDRDEKRAVKYDDALSYGECLPDPVSPTAASSSTRQVRPRLTPSQLIPRRSAPSD